MRIERTQLSAITSVAARSRETAPDAPTDGADTVSIRFAAKTERIISIAADFYEPQPAEIANALMERAFDR